MQPPDAEPPPVYAAYPRGATTSYGSADKLKALSDGYFGLNKVFLVNFLLLIAISMGAAIVANSQGTIAIVAGAIVLCLIAGFMSYPSTKRIGYAANWSPSSAVLASFLIGLFAFVCFGAIGFVVVQQLASNEMRRYGLQGSAFGGIKKNEVARLIAEISAREHT